MTFKEVRNSVVSGLYKHIGYPVVPSEQTADRPDFPYCYYSILTPRQSNHIFGLKEVERAQEGFILRRSEPVKAVMSFTFCSQDRTGEDGEYIFGDDEALELAERGHGFFLLTGRCISTEAGDIVVNNIGAVAGRSGFVVEDTIRRYGFDVKLSYVRTDEVPAQTIARVNPKGKITK